MRWAYLRTCGAQTSRKKRSSCASRMSPRQRSHGLGGEAARAQGCVFVAKKR